MILIRLIVISGCAVGDYFVERGKDLLDIIDVKYSPRGAGLGVKVQATDYIGTGLGLGSYGGMYEKYGRRWVESDCGGSATWIHIGIIGYEAHGDYIQELYLTGIGFIGGDLNTKDYIFWFDRFRVGFEICVPLFNVGIYINVGQIFDFLLGIFGIDLIDDNPRKPLVREIGH